MTKDQLIKFLTSVFGTTLKIDDTKLASYANDDGTIKPEAVTEILATDQSRVDKLVTDNAAKVTASHDKGYQKAQSEAATKLENEWKAKFGITSDKIGTDLISEIIAAEVKKSGKKELTESEVVASVPFQNLKKELDAANQKFTDREQQDKQNRITLIATKQATDIFKSLNPVLSTDPAKAAKQEELFIKNYISNNEFALQGEGESETVVPIDKVTKEIKKDKQYNPLTIADEFAPLVKDTYDIQQADPKKAPPAPGGPPAPGVKSYSILNLKPPTNKDEYMSGISKIQKEIKVDADRTKALIEFDADWDAAKPKV